MYELIDLYELLGIPLHGISVAKHSPVIIIYLYFPQSSENENKDYVLISCYFKDNKWNVTYRHFTNGHNDLPLKKEQVLELYQEKQTARYKELLETYEKVYKNIMFHKMWYGQ